MSQPLPRPAGLPAPDPRWLAALAEASPLPMFASRDGLVYASAAWEAVTGWRPEELLGHALADFAPPEAAERLRDWERRVAAGEAPPPLETLFRTRGGGSLRLELHGTTVATEAGTCALGVALAAGGRHGEPEPARDEHWFRALAETTATAVIVYGAERIVYVNQACEALTGYSQEELLGMSAVDLAHPDHQEVTLQRMTARLQGEPVASRYELKIRTKDGSIRWVDYTAGLVPLGGEAVALGTAFDITERKLIELALRETNERLEQERERAQVTLASIGDGVIRTDARGLIDYLNPVAERLTGWRAAEACGQPLARIFQVIDEVARKPLPDPVERCLREGRVVELPGPAVLVRRDGVEFAVRDSAAPVRDREGRITGSVVVFKDVSELRGMERQMRFLARHDPLTGVLNRRELERRLERAIELAQERAGEHALLYVDLDEFKLVNDTCGHVAGDELLKQVAAELASRLPAGGMLARVGGDEFAMLLEDTDVGRARAVAEDIRGDLARFRFRWEDRSFRLGVALGLVPITAGSGGLNQVLSAADAACYVAKERGGDRIHEWQPDDTLVGERYGELQWIQRIPRALEDGSFVLFCQPILPLGPGATEPLCEILLRLRDAEGRLVSPAAFIPAAERYRLIGAIDRWVVHAALTALAAGADGGETATCYAINLSGQSLGDEAFLEHVLAELEASGVPPARLCFEVTETAAVANLARAQRTIAALKGLGCRFVLDDFGSGLSSFAYLKNLPVDFLKIDGEFVRGMSAGSVERALVASINQIGHVMGIRTIAESVEDDETLEAVRALGIDYAQGFVIAHPQPLPLPSRS
ncbi:MAG TPA: EAL domain-containing protein [Thermoanaerobaculia bacterium]|nr:EAL domain-containing protein [Thermoanaerobaculia bacterium]